MNTKTMRLPPRRALTSNKQNPTSNKRKEREEFNAVIPSKLAHKPDAFRAVSAKTSQAAESARSSKLVAGYLAHEFLTKGTLFGEVWDPSRSQQATVSAEESKTLKPIQPKPNKEAESEAFKKQRYVEISHLLKNKGAHIAGIVNPTQLARFLQM